MLQRVRCIILLTLANVSYISEPDAPGLTIELKRHEYRDEWGFNKVERRPTRQ